MHTWWPTAASRFYQLSPIQSVKAGPRARQSLRLLSGFYLYLNINLLLITTDYSVVFTQNNIQGYQNLFIRLIISNINTKSFLSAYAQS